MTMQMKTLEFSFATYKPETPASLEPLHTVSRRGQIARVTWDELTAYERKSIRQAQERAAYVDLFEIYG